MKTNGYKTRISLTITLLFVYVMLFEFILPVNKVLPKPSLLIESFISCWSDYNLLTALAITTTIIYLSLMIGYFLMALFAKNFFHYFVYFKDLTETLKVYRYIPSIFAPIIFIYWFNNSIIAEFLFGFITVIFFLKLALLNEVKNIKEEYYLAAKNLGLSNKEVYRKVIYKSIQPSLFSSIDKIHYYLWIIILIYEFIGGGNGFGRVYYKILAFNDFTALFAVTIIISFLIWLGSLSIKFIHEKYFFWES